MLNQSNSKFAVAKHHYGSENSNIFDTTAKISGQVDFYNDFQDALNDYNKHYGQVGRLALLNKVSEDKWYGTVVVEGKSFERNFNNAGEKV